MRELEALRMQAWEQVMAAQTLFDRAPSELKNLYLAAERLVEDARKARDDVVLARKMAELERLKEEIRKLKGGR